MPCSRIWSASSRSSTPLPRSPIAGGPYCVYAHRAVAALRRRGLNARRLDGGLPEWRADGLPVAGGAP